MSYEQKYLKYKQKYLSLKKRLSEKAQKGGGNIDIMNLNTLSDTPMENQRGGDNLVGPFPEMRSTLGQEVNDNFFNEGESYPSGLAERNNVVPDQRPESLASLSQKVSEPLHSAPEVVTNEVAAVETVVKSGEGVAAIDRSPITAEAVKPKMKVVIAPSADAAPVVPADPVVPAAPAAPVVPDVVPAADPVVPDVQAAPTDIENVDALATETPTAPEVPVQAPINDLSGQTETEVKVELAPKDTPAVDATAPVVDAPKDALDTSESSPDSGDSALSTEAPDKLNGGASEYSTTDVSEYFLKGGKKKRVNRINQCDSTPSSSDYTSTSSESSLSSSDICSSEFDL
jgi:hypothetical protein